MAVGIDGAALTTRIDPAEVQIFRTRVAQRPAYRRGIKGARLRLVLVAMMLAALALVVLTISGDEFRRSLGRGGTAAVFSVLWIAAVAALVVIVLATQLRAATGRWRRWARLDAFAQANDMAYAPDGGDVPHPGLTAAGDDPSMVHDCFAFESSGRRAEYGTAFRSTGAARRRVRAAGVLAVRDDAITEPTIAPELLALLTEGADAPTVRVDDTWLIITTPKRFTLESPAVHERVRRIIDAVTEATT